MTSSLAGRASGDLQNCDPVTLQAWLGTFLELQLQRSPMVGCISVAVVAKETQEVQEQVHNVLRNTQ